VARLAHLTSSLTLGAIAPERPKPRFDSGKTFSPFPPLEPHRRLQAKLRRAGPSGFDALEGTGRERIGVAAAGFAYNYAREAVDRLGLQGRVAVLKVATANPLPRELLARFLAQVDEALVVEDVFPHLEEALLAEAGAIGKSVRIEGRRSGSLPAAGETLPDDVFDALARLTGLPSSAKKARATVPLPRRQISFCSGCSHRASYYALAEAFEAIPIRDPIVVGDIGCYTLGFYPPFEILQTMTSMGASLGTAAALARLNPERRVVAVIGDSTLFHAGMPGLVQIAHQRLPVTVLVMDNSVTGSTGQQPHPGSWQHTEDRTLVRIEAIAQACGFPFVRVAGSFQLKRLPGILEEALREPGPALVVSRQACALEPSEIDRRAIVARIDEPLCDGCLACIDEFGCPAFVLSESGSGKIEVNPIECNGCAACKIVCPPGAISFVRREAPRA
jgi:indolepyruvate ferredoxin oxidoreductase alpha subunit